MRNSYLNFFFKYIILKLFNINKNGADEIIGYIIIMDTNFGTNRKYHFRWCQYLNRYFDLRRYRVNINLRIFFF